MTDNDLFIIIKCLLWFLDVPQMPSDEDIKKFIKHHRDKERDK